MMTQLLLALFLSFTSQVHAIDLRSMEEVAMNFESVIQRKLPTQQRFLVHLEPLNPRTNAEIIKKDPEVVLSVWGGMLSNPLMSQDAFILLLCHEVGHLLGGPPLKSRTGWSSTEGQADYFSTKSCAKTFGLDEASLMDAALNLTRIYARVALQPDPTLDHCDSSEVDRTNFGYPTVQCRLDTLLAGWREEPRPRCWFIE